MTDPKQDQDQAPKEPVTYATPIQRVWAWVGVCYMIIIVLLVTYYIANLRFVAGIGQVMLVPALGGAVAMAVLRYRETKGIPWVILALLGLGLAVYNLVLGIPVLLAAL